MKICAHTLVKNEERYLWYAVTSVADHVDKVLLWDMGSSDKTSRICGALKEKYNSLIDFRVFRKVPDSGYTTLRQKMLDETKEEWVLIVDGDEVWWDESIGRLAKTIKTKGEAIESIVTPFVNIIGDLYHYQENAAGKYEIDGKKGHLTIRAMSKKIPGLYTKNPHGKHGYFDGKGRLIQERDAGKRIFLDSSYMHFTNMTRSGGRELDRQVPKRSFKYKVELGKEFPRDFYFPESFFKSKPDFVPDVFAPMSRDFRMKALVLTPMRKIKRRLYDGKVGY
jgi:glycosyltransferase involved in cell wall biosynthesis